jgi:DNA-binding NtrC family response regulator
MRQFSARYRIEQFELPADVMTRLTAYDWPGNARELRNVIERIALRAAYVGSLKMSDLPHEIAPAAAVISAKLAEQNPVSVADLLFEQMARRGESFWSAVYPMFMSRDLSREDLRAIVSRGLEESKGSYKLLVELFNMRLEDYKRFLNFLRKYDCQIAFQDYRVRKSVLKFEPPRGTI